MTSPQAKKKRIRKTYSCIPCREKKIKCDRTQPCLTCIAKNQTDLCLFENPIRPPIVRHHLHHHHHHHHNKNHHDFTSSKMSQPSSSNDSSNDPSPSRRMIDQMISKDQNKNEVLSLLQYVESKLERLENIVSNQDDQQRMESFHISSSNENFTGNESFYDDQRLPLRIQHQKEDSKQVIQELLRCLPPFETAKILLHSYTFKVRCMTGNSVYTPSMEMDLEKLYSYKTRSNHSREPETDHILQGGLGGPAWLAILFMVLTLGLRYHASPLNYAECLKATEELVWYPIDNSNHSLTNDKQQHQVQIEFKTASNQYESLWIRCAVKCMELANYLYTPTFQNIQAIQLLLVYISLGGASYDSFHASFWSIESVINEKKESFKNSTLVIREPTHLPFSTLLRTAISHAQAIKLHRIPRSEHGMETEVKRRVWWSLCFREFTYCSEDILNRLPVIRLDDILTDLPCNMNDQDGYDVTLAEKESFRELDVAVKSEIDERYTIMSFIRTMLRFACLLQEQNEIHIRQSFQKDEREKAKETAKMIERYKTFTYSLPSFFYGFSSTDEKLEISCATLDVQKWFLQSSVLNRLMLIYRDTLYNDEIGREMCAEAAKGILLIQQDIRGQFAIVDTFWISLAQSYTAAICLCEHYLITSNTNVHLMDRSMLLELVNEAISTLLQIAPRDPSATRCAHILQMLVQYVRQRQFSTDVQEKIGADWMVQLINRIDETVPKISDQEISNLDMKRPYSTPTGMDLSFKFRKDQNSIPSIQTMDIWDKIAQESETETFNIVWSWLYSQGEITLGSE